MPLGEKTRCITGDAISLHSPRVRKSGWHGQPWELVVFSGRQHCKTPFPVAIPMGQFCTSARRAVPLVQSPPLGTKPQGKLLLFRAPCLKATFYPSISSSQPGQTCMALSLRGGRGGREPALSLGYGCSGCSRLLWGLPLCLFSSVLSSAAQHAAWPGSHPAGKGNIPNLSHGTQNDGLSPTCSTRRGFSMGQGDKLVPSPIPHGAKWLSISSRQLQCPSHTPPCSSSLLPVPAARF